MVTALGPPSLSFVSQRLAYYWVLSCMTIYDLLALFLWDVLVQYWLQWIIRFHLTLRSTCSFLTPSDFTCSFTSFINLSTGQVPFSPTSLDFNSKTSSRSLLWYSHLWSHPSWLEQLQHFDSTSIYYLCVMSFPHCHCVYIIKH